MPVIIPDEIPAKEILKNENVFFIEQSKYVAVDEPSVRILILNLMPLKIVTETQLLRLLANAPYKVEVDFMRIKGHESKNTSKDHLDKFYITFDDVKRKSYDGFIITGAPVELMKFEEVTYWDELKEIFNWSGKNVISTFFICWAAQAALYHFYHIPKYTMNKKLFGVFLHKINNKKSPIVRGFDDEYLSPHSRYTEILKIDIENKPELEIISDSEDAGVSLIASHDMKRIFVTGHSEYDAGTLKEEYERDIAKGIDIHLPKNYFPFNDPKQMPVHTWRSNGYLLFQNWLNQCVYHNKYFNQRLG